MGCSSWFSIRLTVLSFIVNMSAVGYSLFAKDVTPALIGLLLTYSVTLNDSVIGMVMCLAGV